MAYSSSLSVKEWELLEPKIKFEVSKKYSK
jgi:hypothetical protein